MTTNDETKAVKAQVSVKDAIKTLNGVSENLEGVFVKMIGDKAKGLVSSPQIKDDYIVVTFAIDLSKETVVLKPDVLRELADAVEAEGVLSKVTLGEGKLTVAVRTA